MPARVDDAVARGCIDAAGLDPHADVTFVAVPVLAVADQVKRALAETAGVVTDVGSVKGAIVRRRSTTPASSAATRWPAASSTASTAPTPTMFSGAVWVLTPSAATADTTIAAVAAAVAPLGAEVVAMTPERHDEMVAVVSHVPHLTAASLMGLAADGAEEHAALLRLAAGGFRDMTRIASGQPDIWLDICAENRPAIVGALDRLIGRLGEMREIVGTDDRDGLLDRLQRARDGPHQPAEPRSPARRTLAEVRIPIPDRPGAAAEIFTLAAELGHQHRQLRGRPPRREQRRCRRRARRRRRRRPLPRRSLAGQGCTRPSRRCREACCAPPAGPVDAVVAVPGSKSIANRALVVRRPRRRRQPAVERARRRRHRGHGALPRRPRRRRSRRATTARRGRRQRRAARSPARRASTPGSPARRRASSPPSPPSPTGPVTIDGDPPLRAAADGAAARRAATLGARGRVRRGRRPPAGHRHRAARGAAAPCACAATCPASTSRR